jgi:hypothetical protein
VRELLECCDDAVVDDAIDVTMEDVDADEIVDDDNRST